MQTKLNPYIGFTGNAREAMEFYKDVFGGNLNLNTFGELAHSEDPKQKELIMHGQLDTSNGLTIMGADMAESMNADARASMSISLSGDNNDELSGYFTKLSAGGTVTEPLAVAPWGDTFGMVTDKFGINWMVSIAKKAE